jgi:hypothetical protein
METLITNVILGHRKMRTSYLLQRTFTSPQHPIGAISTQVVSRKELSAKV